MLLVGIKTINLGEILGQLIRIPAGIVGSFINVVPRGNTGGSNVSALKPTPIPEDLKKYLH